MWLLILSFWYKSSGNSNDLRINKWWQHAFTHLFWTHYLATDKIVKMIYDTIFKAYCVKHFLCASLKQMLFRGGWNGIVMRTVINVTRKCSIWLLSREFSRNAWNWSLKWNLCECCRVAWLKLKKLYFSLNLLTEVEFNAVMSFANRFEWGR